MRRSGRERTAFFSSVDGDFVLVAVCCDDSGARLSRVDRMAVGIGRFLPLRCERRRDEIVALRRAGQVFPLAVAAAQTERYVCRPGEIHDLQRYGIGPEVVAFFRNRNQSLQTVGRRNFVAAAVGVFHMDRHGVVAAR